MGYSEEDAATVSCDVAPLVDDMEKAATYNLEKMQFVKTLGIIWKQISPLFENGHLYLKC